MFEPSEGVLCVLGCFAVSSHVTLQSKVDENLSLLSLKL